MRRTISIGILIGSFLLAACSGSPSGSNSPAGTGSGGGAAGGGGSGGGGATELPPAANLTIADPSGGTGPFAIANLERLVLTVDGSHLGPGEHAVRLDVTSPGGTLYAQLRSSLAVGQDGRGRTTTSLQVRGSVIESFQQAGSWQLVVHVDGAPMAAASVELTE